MLTLMDGLGNNCVCLISNVGRAMLETAYSGCN